MPFPERNAATGINTWAVQPWISIAERLIRYEVYETASHKNQGDHRSRLPDRLDPVGETHHLPGPNCAAEPAPGSPGCGETGESRDDGRRHPDASQKRGSDLQFERRPAHLSEQPGHFAKRDQ